MRISSLLNENGILLKSKPKSKEEVINTLVECHFRLGNLNDKDSFRKAVLEREASTSTGIGGGMAIPHAMTEAVKRPAITAMTVEDGVDFKSLDGKPVNLIFMIAMPNDGKQHMNLLSHLATLMMDKSLFPSLTAVETPAEFIDFIDKLEDKLFPDEASEKSEPIEENKGYKILAVTACPMGISHTYMAAEALEKTAKEMHYSIKVETNGSAGAANVLTDEEIENAAKASYAHNFIKRLPKGYDTVIGEDGGSLSQGQKQLLCIARVMLCLPPMLILDEATSSIDTRTEVKIQDAFSKMMEGRTTFIVAHRLSTIKEADVILVMKDGKIIEQGNHEELLEKRGFYYKLYNS